MFTNAMMTTWLGELTNVPTKSSLSMEEYPLLATPSPKSVVAQCKVHLLWLSHRFPAFQFLVSYPGLGCRFAAEAEEPCLPPHALFPQNQVFPSL